VSDQNQFDYRPQTNHLPSHSMDTLNSNGTTKTKASAQDDDDVDEI